nr:LysM peptidoglycan-binding domain-containing protein [Ligilactobacillus agilis]
MATITGLFPNSALKKDLSSQQVAFSQQLNQAQVTVKAGDTLSQIAADHNLTTEQLVKVNQIANPDLIYPGQVINLSPGQAGTPVQANQSPANPTVPSLSSQAEEEARAWIAAHESSGSYTAKNGKYYGKYQLDLAYLKGDLSPANQEKTANNYVHNRYGSWVKAKEHWLSHNWY